MHAIVFCRTYHEIIDFVKSPKGEDVRPMIKKFYSFAIWEDLCLERVKFFVDVQRG